MSVHPILQYADADAALDWIERAFGFGATHVSRDDAGTIVHAEIAAAGGVVMLSGTGTDRWGDHRGQGWLYVAVDDVDGLHRRASEAGADIVMAPADQEYGSRDFTARDLEGNLWSFGTYSPGS